eukprot:CAMPEP_0184083562 /NCGR_PEP_ID=MMETSP0974-20121125/3769_1 /TAXON_ID=483370 /ORGANISM="non described non described, Strain CCMP2097" /LENGTH=398 /DNA_ID=CAMNT_0026386239 /DNA_START=152 /DNA_END=1347 /DNA_ORIENTATION=-
MNGGKSHGLGKGAPGPSAAFISSARKGAAKEDAKVEKPFPGMQSFKGQPVMCKKCAGSQSGKDNHSRMGRTPASAEFPNCQLYRSLARLSTATKRARAMESGSLDGSAAEAPRQQRARREAVEDDGSAQPPQQRTRREAGEDDGSSSPSVAERCAAAQRHGGAVARKRAVFAPRADARRAADPRRIADARRAPTVRRPTDDARGATVYGARHSAAWCTAAAAAGSSLMVSLAADGAAAPTSAPMTTAKAAVKKLKALAPWALARGCPPACHSGLRDLMAKKQPGASMQGFKHRHGCAISYAIEQVRSKPSTPVDDPGTFQYQPAEAITGKTAERARRLPPAGPRAHTPPLVLRRSGPTPSFRGALRRRSRHLATRAAYIPRTARCGSAAKATFTRMES